MPRFRGIIAALITSFDENGEIYEPGVINEITYLKEKRIGTIFACGSYGAFPLMSDQQRLRMAELVPKTAKAMNLDVILQIGSCSTADAVRYARRAESAGADAVSAVVPFYYSAATYKEDDFLRYFEAIIRSVSIPVHCYNNAKTTGFNVSPAFLGRMIDAGLRGIKDGGSEMERIIAMLKVVSEKGVDFDYYPSSTSALITGFLLGVPSCISGVSLSAPEMVLEIYDAVSQNDAARAVELFKTVMKVRAALGKFFYRALAAYDVLHAKGIDVGTCKLPWRRLSPEQAGWVIEELKSVGIAFPDEARF